MALELAHENIWFDKWRVDDAEREFYEKKYLIREECEVEVYDQDETEDISDEDAHSPQEKTEEKGGSGLGSLANQIAKARQEIQNSLASGGRGGGAPAGGASADVLNRITKLEGDNSFLTKRVSALEQTIINLTKQLEALQCTNKTTTAPMSQKKPEPQKEEEDDDDIDLFGSDSEEEDEDAARVREERLKAYAEKKSKKPGPIAKSSVLLDCKPWDDETDMKVMENEVRKIEMDGLKWGAAKLVPLAFGIQKLSILCTVEDEKVSIDDLSEKIQEIEDFVQSVDVAAFNKC